MWPFQSEQKYSAVAREEEGPSLDVEPKSSQYQRRSSIWSWKIGAGITISVIAVLLIGLLGADILGFNSITIEEPPTEDTPLPATEEAGCQPRREWRTLSDNEKQDYISAVLCLRDATSTLAPSSNHTAYDDFPWIHSHVGYATHNSAPFLPWHRYFLHIYETTLREKCGYTGGLVYWDWTLDFEALENSPIFNPATGFGGDGEVGGEITVGRSGRCLVDGPFAGTKVDFYDVKFQPHCLSRGFRDLEGNLGHMDGADISPDSIEAVLSSDGYEEFVAAMESKVHDAIPFGIAGDFETFTAPYDPVFFLHHTQLDRLWWLWQQRQPNRGLDSYGGHKERHSVEMASLDDDLHYKGLAPDVKVKDVMDIENGMLCYQY